MNWQDLVTEIQNKLVEISNSEFVISSQSFFKEPVKIRGVRTPVVQKLARGYFGQIDKMNRADVFKLCDDLMASDYMEDFFVACEFAYRIRPKFEFNDFKTLEGFVKKYVNNWAKCDTFCNHTIGSFIEKFPKIIPEIKKWARNKNLWVRRASAVSFILLARHGKFIDDVFEIADILLMDLEDMVQKGYGWALKVIGEKQPKLVYDFVMVRRNKMPRTAFRYAIEKLPPDMQKLAMTL